jgi:hypothetical protein
MQEEFLQNLIVVKWLEKPIQGIVRLLAGSEIVKKSLTASELQCTISAMKGGGV